MYLLLSITKRCNMRCPNCFFSMQSAEFFADKDITPDAVMEIVEFYRNTGIRQVIPYAEGEALLHPQYQEIVAYIVEKLKNKPWLVTNGSRLADHAEFVARHLCEVVVSVDSPSAEGYAAYRGNASGQFFNLALHGIEKVITAKKQYRSTIHVVINCVVTADRCHEIPAMIKLAEELGVDAIRFTNFHPTGADIAGTPLSADNQTVLEVMRGIIRRSDYQTNIYLPNLLGLARLPFTCRMLATIFIGANGDFSPCCRIASASRWGNFLRDEGKHNSSALRKFRSEFYQAKAIGELPIICQGCGYLNQLRPVFLYKNQQWVKSSAF
jgi:MoaA/NifB/PqqE/SkfB family radical SAM enzyme